jgi:hypothetical protein
MGFLSNLGVVVGIVAGVYASRRVLLWLLLCPFRIIWFIITLPWRIIKFGLDNIRNVYRSLLKLLLVILIIIVFPFMLACVISKDKDCNSNLKAVGIVVSFIIICVYCLIGYMIVSWIITGSPSFFRSVHDVVVLAVTYLKR